jgi:hypothetical protein
VVARYGEREDEQVEHIGFFRSVKLLFDTTMVTACCYGWDLECPSEARVLRAWSPSSGTIVRCLEHQDSVFNNGLIHQWIYSLMALWECFLHGNVKRWRNRSLAAYLEGCILSLSLSVSLCLLATMIFCAASG